MNNVQYQGVSLSTSHSKFLQDNLVPLRLSCILPNGFPLVVSLWYLYEDGKIICASAKSSKIIDYLSQNHRVGFEIAADTPPYCGIRGYGTVGLSEDAHHTRIKQLYLRYFKNDGSELFKFLTHPDREEMVITITPQQLFDWNFSKRMQDSHPRQNQQICP